MPWPNRIKVTLHDGTILEGTVIQVSKVLKGEPHSVGKLIYRDDYKEGNPRVQCPICRKRGKLMDDFSLLAAGFNGIKTGSVEDLNVQECGKCAAKLEW